MNTGRLLATLARMTTPSVPEPFKVWTDRDGVERYLHGTKADLSVGDLIEAGRASNYGDRNHAAFVYLTATLDAATWGAELAIGEGRGRIYLVEPTGPIEDDPNLTDKKFPGNPTRSYRTRAPLRVIGELTGASADDESAPGIAHRTRRPRDRGLIWGTRSRMHVARATIANDTSQPIEVALEPSGMVLLLEPGCAFETSSHSSGS